MNTQISIFKEFFGAYFLQAELEFYNFFNVFCERLSEETSLNFYKPSTNSLYIVPFSQDYFLLSNRDDSFQRYVSFDAAGIACTLSTLNTLIQFCKKVRKPDYVAEEKFNRRFLGLSEYAKTHPEKEAILSVIH